MENWKLIALLGLMPLLHGCIAAVGVGAGTAVLVHEDRRTVGTVTEDQGIELKSGSRIGERFRDVHINSTSYNRMLLLTGEAPTAGVKAEIEKIARSIENVRGVYNEIAVAGNSALTSRANDSFLTGKVKARFVDQKKFNPVHVKVVTEAGIVYLMGMAKRKEAEDATEIARTTSGVQKVVRLFEIID